MDFMCVILEGGFDNDRYIKSIRKRIERFED